MTPREWADFIAEHGETMTLKRSGQSDLTIYGKRYAAPVDSGLAGTRDSVAFKVKLPHVPMVDAAWPHPPRKTDQVTIGGRTYVVVTARPLGDAGETHGWDLDVAGIA